MKTLYIDMDNVLVDFPSGIQRTPEHIQDEFDGRLDEVPGIFSLMDPIPGAITAYEELSTLFDTYILSTAPWGNPAMWTWIFILKNCGWGIAWCCVPMD
jgi:5'(3')-deoxyribonucleotidase